MGGGGVKVKSRVHFFARSARKIVRSKTRKIKAPTLQALAYCTVCGVL